MTRHGHDPKPARELEHWLGRVAGKAVHVTLTDNRQRMLSWRETARTIDLRMHHMFVNAPVEVIADLGLLVGGKGQNRERIRAFIRANDQQIRKPSPAERRVVLRPVGVAYDLRDILADLGERFFDPVPTVTITWGRAVSQKTVRAPRFGTYDHQRALITVSRRLDRPDTPRYAVEFIVYHELLHAVLGWQKAPAGRRRMHTAEFRRLESTFPQVEQAKKHLQSLVGH